MPLPPGERDLLRRIPLFEALDEDDLDWIAGGQRVGRRRVRRGRGRRGR